MNHSHRSLASIAVVPRPGRRTEDNTLVGLYHEFISIHV